MQISRVDLWTGAGSGDGETQCLLCTINYEFAGVTWRRLICRGVQ